MRISEITEMARAALEEPVTACSPDELIENVLECQTAMRVLLAHQLRHIAEIERLGLPSRLGARNTQCWLRQLLHISGSEAAALVKVAWKVEEPTALSGAPLAAELPATATAVREGALGLDHARVIVEGMRNIAPLVSRQQREEAEILLVENARVLGAHEVRVLAERLVYHFDQDGALRDEENQFEARELHFAVARDGMTVLKGRLDRETGAKLRAALEPLAAPSPEDDGEKDPRTPGQRNADALSSLLDIALSTDGLPRVGGQRPHLAVTIDFDSLRRRIPRDTPGAAGTLENTGQPLTSAHIRRLACDAEVLPMVLGSEGQPLDVGRAQRTAPPQVRAALLARDSSCAFPGCDHPPGTSEAHHIVHWVDGGESALDNMVMLCASHHRIVHSQRWDIALDSGRPVFIPPSSVDPWRKPIPGNRPLRQRDLAPLIAS